MTTVIDSGLLSRVLKGAAVCGQEIQIESAEDGWHVGTLDPSHTSMTFADVPASCFREYGAQGTLRFRTEDMDLLLKRRGDVVLEKRGGSLEATAGNLTRRIRLFEPEEERTPPNPDTTNLATFDVSLIRDAVNAFDARRVPMALLHCTDDTLTVIVEEQGAMQHVHAVVTRDDCLEWEFPDGWDFVDVRLSLEWLQAYLRSLPPDELVTLRFAKDYPVVADTSLGDARFRWMCAPMVEE